MARDIKQLHPRLQKLANKLVNECAKNGLKIGISECFRSVAEQDALYAKGRTDKSSGVVTNVRGSTYSSMHQWGVAFDFYRNDGKGAYNDNDGFFTKVGKIGVRLGLEWGGNWKSFKDKPHFQLPDWGSGTSKLKSTYKTFERFKATWNESVVEPLIDKPSETWVKSLQLELNKQGYKASNGKALTVDGKVGALTQSACPTLRIGYSNKVVELAQTRLNELGFSCGKADGKYGKNTGLAVQKMKEKIIGTKNPTTSLGAVSWQVLLGIYKK